ncbi:carbohydrate-binding module family 12 protein [Amanita rubescens]|nr:carbohydrate-binding module family 12 protein [Amanita rubescens]
MVQYWEPGTQYNFGDVVQFEGHKYKIIQPHRSQSDWTPPITPALWGKLQDGDDGCQQQQQQPQQHQYQPPSNPPYSDGAPQYGADQGSYPAEKPSNDGSEQQGEKKHFWDDEGNVKKLEIGGALLAGAAAIGAGIFAHKQHEKKKEEGKSQEWAQSHWLAEAQDRTNTFRRDGPQGPVTWVLAEGKNIPRGALPVSTDPYNMYTCRAFIDGGLQLGKASSEFNSGAVIGYKNHENHIDVYEILLGDPRGVHWVSVSGKVNLAYLKTRPVEGGKENDGTPLFIARAYHKDAVHPGKANPNFDGAYIPWGGKEVLIHQYEILCYA